MSGTVRSAEQARDQLGEAVRWGTVDLTPPPPARPCSPPRRRDRGARSAQARIRPRGAEAPVCDRHARVPSSRRQDRCMFLGSALRIKKAASSVESEITRSSGSRWAFERLVALLEGARRGADAEAHSKRPIKRQPCRKEAVRSSEPTRRSASEVGARDRNARRAGLLVPGAFRAACSETISARRACRRAASTSEQEGAGSAGAGRARPRPRRPSAALGLLRTCPRQLVNWLTSSRSRTSEVPAPRDSARSRHGSPPACA